jgi:hypothetical protein
LVRAEPAALPYAKKVQKLKKAQKFTHPQALQNSSIKSYIYKTAKNSKAIYAFWPAATGTTSGAEFVNNFNYLIF